MAPILSSLPSVRLARNSGYLRYLPLCLRPTTKEKVHRKWCSGCRTSFVLLPNDVVPLHKYGLTLICSRLTASLGGQADHSRDFYEDMGLISAEPATEVPVEAMKGTSWSDQLDSRPLCPSPQLFRHWRRKWGSRARVWLLRLLLACIHAGCDLKAQLGESLESFVDCPEGLRSLVLATGLVALLQEEPARTSLPAAVFLLGCSSSHKIVRVSGRPPPHYGGDLEFPDDSGQIENGDHKR